MKVVVTDWEFSTARPCDKCGNYPEDYWSMARIEVEAEKPGMHQMNWVCIMCLGEMVVAHE